MIKKVKTADLRPGVYIHDFNCDESADIIFIEKARITEERTIDILKSWGIEEVLIDTEKGCDVNPKHRRADGTDPAEDAIAQEAIVVDATSGNLPIGGPVAVNPPDSQTNSVSDSSTVFTGTGQASYTVQSGDTLFAIAQRYGVPVAGIAQANGLASDVIYAGQTLIIPSADDIL